MKFGLQAVIIKTYYYTKYKERYCSKYMGLKHDKLGYGKNVKKLV